jgi:hypothetical protein
METADELPSLHAKVAELEARLTTSAPERTTRRRMLRLTGAAVAGATAAAVTGGRPAAAAGSLTTDSFNNLASSPTALSVQNANRVTYGVAVIDNTLAALDPFVLNTAVFGHAKGTAFSIGVAASAYNGNTAMKAMSEGTNAEGIGVFVDGPSAVGIAVGAQGLESVALGVSGQAFGAVMNGARGALVLQPTVVSVPNSGASYVKNTLETGYDDDLWYCVATGSPGSWRKLAGPATAGAFHAITPTRVYDSRVAAPSPGLITGGSHRTVSVKDGRNPTTGAVVAADVLPAGTRAIACNLTVVGTSGAGSLTVNPGGVTTATAASINWNAAGQVHNNGIVAAINPATLQVTVVSSGAGSTHFVLDVTGYWR